MVVKPWIDETTREKFQILGSDYLPVLLRYIDEKQIPVELGGANLHWMSLSVLSMRSYHSLVVNV